MKTNKERAFLLPRTWGTYKRPQVCDRFAQGSASIPTQNFNGRSRLPFNVQPVFLLSLRRQMKELFWWTGILPMIQLTPRT